MTSRGDFGSIRGINEDDLSIIIISPQKLSVIRTVRKRSCNDQQMDRGEEGQFAWILSTHGGIVIFGELCISTFGKG